MRHGSTPRIREGYRDVERGGWGDDEEGLKRRLETLRKINARASLASDREDLGIPEEGDAQKDRCTQHVQLMQDEYFQILSREDEE